jgi:hypothetical protein
MQGRFLPPIRSPHQPGMYDALQSRAGDNQQSAAKRQGCAIDCNRRRSARQSAIGPPRRMFRNSSTVASKFGSRGDSGYFRIHFRNAEGNTMMSEGRTSLARAPSDLPWHPSGFAAFGAASRCCGLTRCLRRVLEASGVGMSSCK